MHFDRFLSNFLFGMQGSVLILLLFLLPLLLGWLADYFLGDPLSLPHPIVGFGRMIAFGEKRLNKGNYRKVKGAFMSVFYIVAVFLLTLLILLGLVFVCVYTILLDDFFRIAVAFAVASLILAIGIFFCLAGTTLIREVRMVFEAVDRSLEEGRKQVARIVGRDTAALSAQEVRTAALETLSENLSDGVVAPMFWYMWLGLPGMMAYKMINTLDSMIGYKTARYFLFGRIAAKIDDVANYIPARFTAWLMILVSGKLHLFSFVRRYGRQHASPNSGYPEAALAGILNCRFGGTHDYFGESISKPYIGHNERELATADMQIAIRINRRVELVMLLLTFVVSWITSSLFLFA